jgi:hypothetical protein
MTTELVALIAVLSTVAGAGLVVLRDWWNTPAGTPVNLKSLAKNLVIAGLAALTIVNIVSLPDPNGSGFLWTGIVVSGIISGAGVKTIVGHS